MYGCGRSLECGKGDQGRVTGGATEDRPAKGHKLQNHGSGLKDRKRQSFWSQMSVTVARNTVSGLPTSMSQHGSGFVQFIW